MRKHKSDRVNAMCSTLKGTRFELDYSPNVIEHLRSGNINRFIDGLRITYHEVAPVLQECSIAISEINGEKVHYTASMFQIAQENVARVADSQFYDENYDNLVLETKLIEFGSIKGYLAIQKYALQHLKHYSADKIMAEADQYDEQSNFDVTVFGKSSDRSLQLDNICNDYIGANNHLEMLQKYPILQLAYNLDGIKKDIITLLKDWEDIFKKQEQ